MERFKERIAQMRTEIETADTQAEAAAARAKQLETEGIRKGHEQKSLTLRVKSLQEQLDKKQNEYQQMIEKCQGANDRAELLEKKMESLQQTIEAKEVEHGEMNNRYKEAKAEMDELERQLEGV